MAVRLKASSPPTAPSNLGVLSSQLRAETELTVEDFSTWNVVGSQGSFNGGLYIDQGTALVNGLLLFGLLFISLQRITGFDVYIKEGLRRWREQSREDQAIDQAEDKDKTDS